MHIYNGVVKEVSTGVVSCNMFAFVKLFFELPLRDKFHEKYNLSSTSSTVTEIAMVIETTVSTCDKW